MELTVVLSKKVAKSLNKVPKHILFLFDEWVETIEIDGYESMRAMNGYRDHSLSGNRKGQRSSSLNRSWRVIYIYSEEWNQIIIQVIEVTKHDY